MNTPKHEISEFISGTEALPVEFVDSYEVVEGVACETYNFSGDDSRDLAVIHVQPNKMTPRQKVVFGDETIEGWVSGAGELEVDGVSGESRLYNFKNGQPNEPVSVKIGETMQWRAGDDELTFFEICEPKYSEGRFEMVGE
ncbi:MAG: hypothetical protein ABI220_01740 [Candidatus Saccharimonadales bacterium]